MRVAVSSRESTALASGLIVLSVVATIAGWQLTQHVAPPADIKRGEVAPRVPVLPADVPANPGIEPLTPGAPVIDSPGAPSAIPTLPRAVDEPAPQSPKGAPRTAPVGPPARPQTGSSGPAVVDRADPARVVDGTSDGPSLPAKGALRQ